MAEARALVLALALAVAAPSLRAMPPASGGLGDFSSYSLGAPQTGLATRRLGIRTQAGKTLEYSVEIAATPQQQATGMMHRKSMGARSGMLFPMQPARPASFYMRNTYVPLDIIFIDANRRVLNIGANATPLSEALISSAGPVIAVLELRGGEAARIGLKPGDRIDW